MRKHKKFASAMKRELEEANNRVESGFKTLQDDNRFTDLIYSCLGMKDEQKQVSMTKKIALKKRWMKNTAQGRSVLVIRSIKLGKMGLLAKAGIRNRMNLPDRLEITNQVLFSSFQKANLKLFDFVIFQPLTASEGYNFRQLLDTMWQSERIPVIVDEDNMIFFLPCSGNLTNLPDDILSKETQVSGDFFYAFLLRKRDIEMKPAIDESVLEKPKLQPPPISKKVEVSGGNLINQQMNQQQQQQQLQLQLQLQQQQQRRNLNSPQPTQLNEQKSPIPNPQQAIAAQMGRPPLPPHPMAFPPPGFPNQIKLPPQLFQQKFPPQFPPGPFPPGPWNSNLQGKQQQRGILPPPRNQNVPPNAPPPMMLGPPGTNPFPNTPPGMINPAGPLRFPPQFMGANPNQMFPNFLSPKFPPGQPPMGIPKPGAFPPIIPNQPPQQQQQPQQNAPSKTTVFIRKDGSTNPSPQREKYPQRTGNKRDRTSSGMRVTNNITPSDEKSPPKRRRRNESRNSSGGSPTINDQSSGRWRSPNTSQNINKGIPPPPQSNKVPSQSGGRTVFGGRDRRTQDNSQYFNRGRNNGSGGSGDRRGNDRRFDNKSSSNLKQQQNGGRRQQQNDGKDRRWNQHHNFNNRKKYGGGGGGNSGGSQNNRGGGGGRGGNYGNGGGFRNQRRYSNEKGNFNNNNNRRKDNYPHRDSGFRNQKHNNKRR